jgi:hypothetical protein
MICVCGAICTDCPELHQKCEGDCETMKGKVYWAQYVGAEVCPVYKCVSEHKYSSCADCDDIPCNLWFSLKDPALTDEEHQKSIEERVKLLKST